MNNEIWRRHFLEFCGLGVGRIALASLLHNENASAAATPAATDAARTGNAKAKSIIYLFMEGGPSQLDLFQHKPKLASLNGELTPDSLLAGKKFAFMDRMGAPKLYGTKREFKQYGNSGHWFSSLLPNLAAQADNLSFIHSMKTMAVNHSPAMILAHTGGMVAGRPSMGAWLVYGLGSESKDLPAFVAMTSGPRGPRNGNDIWGSGFLPTNYQGVPFLNAKSPIFYLDSPAGVTPARQKREIEAVADLNHIRFQASHDPEIDTRIGSYELAFRMQSSAPELTDLSRESQATLDLYGATPGKPSFANNCLLARRLVERGVRCVQVYHTDWDHHANIEAGLDKICPQVDRPSAALIADLKQRGLLDSTLVVWGGEFGRTPMSEGGDKNPGRNHLIDGYTTWLAGGGIHPGMKIGETDELGFQGVADPVDIHDLHATLLSCFGLDHKKLTYEFQGRPFRLTDVSGNVVTKLVGAS
jgi:hypothetical protein